MLRKTTVTIGIPAYNEDRNISTLVSSLLKQKSDGYKIDKIIISSDGSTDSTVINLRKVRGSKIKIIDNKDRQGIARGLNQIISFTVSDILVILNGDISIDENSFIDKLIKPILDSQVDLTSCSVKESPAQGFFGKIIEVGSKYRWSVYEKYNSGNNVYTCRGVARAFSKKLYKSIQFTQSVGDDMYSYFYAINNGYKYFYVKNAHVNYKVPTNVFDHKKQSVRYLNSLESMKSIFGNDFVEKNHPWPVDLFIKQGIKFLLKYPLESLLYPLVFFSMKVLFVFKPKVDNLWDIAGTSK